MLNLRDKEIVAYYITPKSDFKMIENCFRSLKKKNTLDIIKRLQETDGEHME